MKRSEGSDRIVFALVIVLGMLIVGIIALEIIEALMGNDTELGPNTATLMATVSGALVGGVAGYVTQSVPKQPEVPEFSAGPLLVAPATSTGGDDSPSETTVAVEGSEAVAGADDAPQDHLSATEAYGPDEGDYEDVSEEWNIR